MSFAIGSLMILTGLSIMGFGLFMFYAWLPLLYALIGFDVGLLLGRASTGEAGTTAIVLGLAGAIILGAASYILEPYRRVLLGVSGGILFGLSVAAAFGLDGWFGGFFGRVLALVCGAVGGLLVPRFFDLFVVGASAVSGAAMVMTGANHILPSVGFFDRAAGGVLPSLVTWRRLIVAAGLATLGFLLVTRTSVAQSSANCRAYAEDYSARYSTPWATSNFNIGRRRAGASAVAAHRSRALQRSTLFDNAYSRCMRGHWP